MSDFPYLPLFTDAYMADCSHLSDAEHGRYIQLLILMWRAPYQRIPNDDEWLARKFRRTAEDVRRDLRPLISEFCQTDGNYITQKRLMREWSYVAKRTQQRSDAAKARWHKGKDPCERNAGSHAFRNAPTPTPTPTLTFINLTDGERGVQGGSEQPPSAAPPPKRKKNGGNGNGHDRGTRLPPEWNYSADVDAWLSERWPEFASDDAPVERELEKFRNYWTAQPGAKGRKADWDATFRNWLMRAFDDRH